MYPVSDAYKEAMQAQFRQVRSRCRVYLGVFDSTASADGKVVMPPAVSYADPETLNTVANVDTTYATFEPQFFRLDGTMKLLPDNSAAADTQGWISAAQADETGLFEDNVILVHEFSEKHSMVGLTIMFGLLQEEVPEQISIIAYADGEVIKESAFTDMTPYYQAVFPVEDTDKLEIRFDKGRTPYARARMNQLSYGIGYTWKDSQLLSVTEKHVDSPMSLELPGASLSFTINNADGQYNVENSTAFTRFLAEGQRVQVDYGIELGDTTEWVPGGKWYLDSWSTADQTATFSAEDRISELTKTTYEKGVYSPEARPLTEYIRDVMLDAGYTEDDYYVGPRIDKITAQVPLPITSHAECLQLLANRARARIYTDRQGRVAIKQLTYDPDVTLDDTSDTQTEYSDAESTMRGSNVYATFEPRFFRLDGSVKLLADDNVAPESGMTGVDTATADGSFGSPLVWQAGDPDNAFDVYQVSLDFAGQVPAEVSVEGYQNGWLPAKVFTPSKNQQSFGVYLQDISGIRIIITRAREAGQRGHLARVALGLGTGFNLTKDQVFTGNQGELTAKMRNATAEWAYLSPAEETEEPQEVANVTLRTNSGEARIEHDLVLNPTVTISESEPATYADVAIEQRHYAYVSYVKLTSATDKDIEVKITGTRMSESKYPLSYQVNATGEDMPVENPMFDNASASDVLEWVGEYYRNRVKRVLRARGFPEVDSGDIIQVDGRVAQVLATELTYNGAFNETFTTREE